MANCGIGSSPQVLYNAVSSQVITTREDGAISSLPRHLRPSDHSSLSAANDPPWQRPGPATPNSGSIGRPAAHVGSYAFGHGSGASWQITNAQPGAGSSSATPADPSIAVGPSQIVQAVNSQLTVVSRSSGAATPRSYPVLFHSPKGWATVDGRVYYDPVSQRWFASAVSYSGSASKVSIAVSLGPDATGRWSVYTLAASPTILYDQPRLGVYGAKIVVATNDVQNWGTTKPAIAGSQLFVVNKAQLLSAAVGAGGNLPKTVARAAFGPTRAWISGALPVQPTPLQAVAMAKSDSAVPVIGNGLSTVQVAAISGVPGWPGGVRLSPLSGAKLPMPYVPGPASVAQPGGYRLLAQGPQLASSSWQGGTIWTGTDTSCVPASDNTVRSCLWLVQLTWPGTHAPPLVTQEGSFGTPGIDLIFPAMSIGANGLVGLVATEVSANPSNPIYPSVVISGLSNGALSSVGWLETLQRYGTTGIGGTSYGVQAGQPARWGDFSGAVTDPVNPAQIWVTGQAAAPYGASPSRTWATALAEITPAPTPTVSRVSPQAGPSTGGTKVTLTGSNLGGVTAVYFGNTAVTAVTVVSPTEITAISPPGTSGTVAVRARDPIAGFSPPTAGTAFRYWGLTTTAGRLPTLGAGPHARSR